MIEELDREAKKPQLRYPLDHRLYNVANYEKRQYIALDRIQEALRMEQKRLEQKAPPPEHAGKARDLQSPKKGILCISPHFGTESRKE